MTDINKLLNTTSAGLLAQKLDAADGKKDGKIEASIWNEFVKGKGGKEVKQFINVEDAMNSITKYVIRNAKTLDKDIEVLAKEWTEAAPASPSPTPAGAAEPPGKPPKVSDNTSAKENAAKEKGLRPTNNSNFYYSETEKEHYKWDNEKQTFVKYPNIAYMAKDGTYRREYKNADGSRRSVNYSKEGYPTKMEARNANGKNYLNRDFAAKKLGLRETHATQTKGIYYDTKTKMHYTWNEKTHAFDAFDKDIRYVETDGSGYVQGTKVKITATTDKKTGKLKSRTEDFGHVAYTYDANGNRTKDVVKDANGKVTKSYENTYDANGNVTKAVVKDANGKVTSSRENTRDANGNVTKSVFKDANGKVTHSYEYTYDANGYVTKSVVKDANGKVTKSYENTYDTNGNHAKIVYKNANGNEITEEEWNKL